MNVFEEVRLRVDIAEVAKYYGLKVHGRNTNCLYHDDRHPSMRLKNGFFHCFTCQAQGDVIDLVAQIHGRSKWDSLKRINNDFSLGLDIFKGLSKNEASKWHQYENFLEAFAKWERFAFSTLVTIEKLLGTAIEIYGSVIIDDDFCDIYKAACDEKPLVEGMLDVLLGDSFEEKLMLFINYRMEVDRYARFIQSHEN